MVVGITLWSQEVLLLNELETLLELCTPEQFGSSSVRITVTPLLAVCICNEHSRVAQRALQMWKSAACVTRFLPSSALEHVCPAPHNTRCLLLQHVTILVCMSHDGRRTRRFVRNFKANRKFYVPRLLPAILRRFEKHWNQTVNKVRNARSKPSHMFLVRTVTHCVGRCR